VEAEIGSLRATVVQPSKETAPPLFLIPGVGFTRAVYAPLQAALAKDGIPSLAVDLPGTGDPHAAPSFDRVADALTRAVEAVPSCGVLAHSLSGPFGQLVAQRANLHALVLVNSFPSDGVSLVPTRGALGFARRHGLALLRGHAIRPSYDEMLAFGLDRAPEAARRAAFDAMVPMPGRVVQQILRRPLRPDSGAVRCHTLVCTARQDTLVHWQVGRRIGEWFNAIIWRYDDLGHLPFFQDEAARLYRNIGEFVLKPHSRKVTEAEAWAPGEGRGLEAREVDRGDVGGARSAYGQRLGRQGASNTDQWDQNLARLAEKSG
jgi:hypothetical protein